MRKDTRSALEKDRARGFEVVKAEYSKQSQSIYDSQIEALEAEAEKERIYKLPKAERALAEYRLARDKEAADTEQTLLNKQYVAQMHSDPRVIRLLRLQEYYLQNEEIDARLLQKVEEAVKQLTTPGANQVIGEKWANDVFAAEMQRRKGIESQLQSETEAFNKRTEKLRANIVNLDDAPDAAPIVETATDAPANLEGSFTFKSDTLTGRAYEIWPEVDNSVRDEIDTALVIAEHGDRSRLEAIVARYAKPVEGEPTEAAASEGGE